jgi:hypothetical protein
MMTWAVILVIVAIVMIMAMNGRGRLPWGNQMRRIQAGVARKTEWMAPEDVVSQVRDDYLASTRWLQDHVMAPWKHQWDNAPTYMSGPYLRRYQTVLTQQGVIGPPRGFGILRADHHVSVRHFTEDGERCLIIDQQLQRRMATYDSRTHDRVMTQDLGDGALVFQMRYDALDRRWKIDEFVQELPLGWGRRRSSHHIRELSALPTTVGRDN